MRMQFRQVLNITILILLISCLIWSCGERKEESKPVVVSKKIAVQGKAVKKETLPVPSADQSEPKADSVAVDEPEASGTKRIYDPKERLNPFVPLFRAENKNTPPEQLSAKTKRKKRIPQTPLERISLNQLKLVAVIRASSGNRALVEDSSGKGYIIKTGTYIGLNAGIVTQINAKGVVVEEELENLLGELVLQHTEIKLQKPAGE